MALIIPAVEASVGKNWLPTLVLVLASFLLCTWMSTLNGPDWKWLRFLRCITLVFLLSWSLGWTHRCWPGRGAAIAVPGLLLALAGYGVWKGSGRNACTVLRYGMYLVLAALGILGVSQIKPEGLTPQAQLPDMTLAVILLLPLIGARDGKWSYPRVGIAAVVSAVLTMGYSTLYDYSRGLSIGGVTEHVESIAACAITAGYFGFITYLLDAMKREGINSGALLVGIAAAYGLYLVGIEIRPEFFAGVILLLWVLVPSFGTVEKNRKKKENKA